MATMEINGGIIAYELFGTGPLLVWNTGGRSAPVKREYLLAGYFSRRGAVLLWDRRNSAGASDIHLSDAESATQADAENLHALLQKLDLGPACIGGASFGCALSLLMAHRYPQDVVSILALIPASRDPVVMGRLADHIWHRLATEAEDGGMQAVVDLSVEAYCKDIAGTAQAGERAVGWLARSLEANLLHARI